MAAFTTDAIAATVRWDAGHATWVGNEAVPITVRIFHTANIEPIHKSDPVLKHLKRHIHITPIVALAISSQAIRRALVDKWFAGQIPSLGSHEQAHGGPGMLQARERLDNRLRTIALLYRPIALSTGGNFARVMFVPIDLSVFGFPLATEYSRRFLQWHLCLGNQSRGMKSVPLRAHRQDPC